MPLVLHGGSGAGEENIKKAVACGINKINVCTDLFKHARIATAKTLEENPEMGVATPYAYHHVIEALLHVGEKEKALELMRTYWGGMIELGADTFWEAFDPKDPNASPYGNTQVNSFCHAWSCTPAWLLREYF